MEAAAQNELARMRRYLPVLDTVITLSPLLGLLGTVTGMIGAFGIMAQAGLNQPTAITGGVAEALIATAAGLGVAIVALVPYNFFQRRAEAMAETIERYGSRLGAAPRRGRARRRRSAIGLAPPMMLRSRTTKKARIEIIPMIDVVFFLLVFFMMTSLAYYDLPGPAL